MDCYCFANVSDFASIDWDLLVSNSDTAKNNTGTKVILEWVGSVPSFVTALGYTTYTREQARIEKIAQGFIGDDDDE